MTIEAAGPVGDKSRWVSELERALLAGEIDVAVHSAKDVPAELADGLELVAIPAREDPRDAICGAGYFNVEGARPGRARGDEQPAPGGADPGGSSGSRGGRGARQRRHPAAQARPRVSTTRWCSRWRVCARLGRSDAIDGVLDEFVPAAGQGALALEARPGSVPVSALIDAGGDGVRARRTRADARARRLVQHAGRRLGAGASRGGELELTAWVGRPDGSAWIAIALRGAAGRGSALRVAERLLAAGAAEMLS